MYIDLKDLPRSVKNTRPEIDDITSYILKL